MAWFRADDKLHSHPKVRRAGLDAMGLWVLAGAYAMDYRTDGFVPEWFIKSWPSGPKIAAKLTRSGLWETAEQDEEPGYAFHDWHEFQLTKDELDSRANGKRAGGALGAHRRWHKDEPSPECPYCHSNTHGSSYG